MTLSTRLPRLAVAAMCLTSFSWAANIVVNPGFESGDLTGWTVNNSADLPWIVQGPGGRGGNPFDGGFYANTGCVGAQCITGTTSQQASLSQLLNTTAGQTYSLSFWFSTDNNGAPNELDVLWNGASILDLGPGGTLGSISSFTQFTVGGLLGTGSDTLTFLGRQDPAYNALDDVCVSTGSVCAVSSSSPEPSSILLIGSVLPLIALVRRLRRAA